jgi:hypothetical protein
MQTITVCSVYSFCLFRLGASGKPRHTIVLIVKFIMHNAMGVNMMYTSPTSELEKIAGSG